MNRTVIFLNEPLYSRLVSTTKTTTTTTTTNFTYLQSMHLKAFVTQKRMSFYPTTHYFK